MDDEHRVLAVLFDIDGTLIDSGGAGGVAWRMAFEELHGIPADIGKFTDAGMTDPEVGRQTFARVIGRDPTPRELAQLLHKRQEHLARAVAESDGYRVLDGVPELLSQLSAQGYLLGLTTGGGEAAAHIKLARGGLNHYFTFGGYGSDSADRTELTRCAVARAAKIIGHALSREQVLDVGDTPKDITASHGAGITAVGVASGHYSVEELKAAGADHVVASLKEGLPL
ncbi:MAG: HAD family hydrolase [Solirubrobacteraceae bacterium]|nr:MAG: HAD family hydrolase [Solirubrobacterales bacterium]